MSIQIIHFIFAKKFGNCNRYLQQQKKPHIFRITHLPPSSLSFLMSSEQFVTCVECNSDLEGKTLSDLCVSAIQSLYGSNMVLK